MSRIEGPCEWPLCKLEASGASKSGRRYCQRHLEAVLQNCGDSSGEKESHAVKNKASAAAEQKSKGKAETAPANKNVSGAADSGE